MTAIMKTVITNGTGRAADIGKPAAGKTGTTDDSKDAYFIGFTPDIATGVWVGNDDNSQMGGITGGTIPAKIWHDVMLVATEPYGKSEFEYPEVILNPFRAANVSIIHQGNDYTKSDEDDLQQGKQIDNQKESDTREQSESDSSSKSTPPIPPVIKPFPLKSESLPKSSKKEASKVDSSTGKAESSSQNYAPIPMQTAPIGH